MEHTLILDEEYEAILNFTGMTAESALIDKLNSFKHDMATAGDKELLAKIKLAELKWMLPLCQYLRMVYQ